MVLVHGQKVGIRKRVTPEMDKKRTQHRQRQRQQQYQLQRKTMGNQGKKTKNKCTSMQSVPPGSSSAIVRWPGTVESRWPSSGPSPKLKNWFHRLWHLRELNRFVPRLCVFLCGVVPPRAQRRSSMTSTCSSVRGSNACY